MLRFSLLAAFAVFVATAHDASALTFQPCDRPDGIVCATVTVPIARDGAVPGTIDLYVEKEAAKSQPSQGALFAFAGGPGGSSTWATTRYAKTLAAGLSTRDLIVFDIRGSGSSGFLTCSTSFINAGDWASCANEIGPRRAYYTTRDAVDDIETVRQALGINRISLYGESYGTKLVLNYARRYPTHIEMLILDSVVEADGFDFYARNTYGAVAPILRELCAFGCPGVSDPVGDTARLAAAARKDGITVSAVVSNGSVQRVRLFEDNLFDLFLWATRYEVVRARYPGAVRSALTGDTLPLGRIWLESYEGHLANRQRVFATGPEHEFSTVLQHLMSCNDIAPAWVRQTPIDQRQQRLSNEFQSIGDAAFYPFDASAPSRDSNGVGCLAWPLAPAAPVISGTYPDVPVLILSSLVDVVTPSDDARKVAALFPHASLVFVPDAGHIVTAFSGAASTCARDRLAQFLAGEQVGSCPEVQAEVRAFAPPTKSLAAVKPAPSVVGKRGRTLAAVIATVNDVYYTSFTIGPYAGLRGGTFTWNGNTNVLTLKGVSWVPGVVVSGAVNAVTGLGTLKVTGTGSRGTVVFRPKRVVTATLDGKKVTSSR
jgi:pimeloyl-ACP methyl ester carboxylesterase